MNVYKIVLHIHRLRCMAWITLTNKIELVIQDIYHKDIITICISLNIYNVFSNVCKLFVLEIPRSVYFSVYAKLFFKFFAGTYKPNAQNVTGYNVFSCICKHFVLKIPRLFYFNVTNMPNFLPMLWRLEGNINQLVHTLNKMFFQVNLYIFT